MEKSTAPTPWRIQTDTTGTWIVAADGLRIFQLWNGYENATQTLRAVNSYDALLAALEAARHELVTLHNLTVSDVRQAGEGDWVTDTSKVVVEIDAALGGFR